jgi:thiamine biosynthesis lipoprotein
MGTHVRVLIEDPVADPAPAGAWARRYLESAAARLTRFDPDSELSRLNAAHGVTHPASPLLRTAVAAALWAAERSDGLVDPTLLPEIARAGYARSRTGIAQAPPEAALEAAPAPKAAEPDPSARWRAVHLTPDGVTRPPGIQIDTGGTTKGLLADAVAHNLSEFASFVVDCGGDLRVGGRAGEPRTVFVQDPLTGDAGCQLRVGGSGVATSAVTGRIWRRADGTHAHHLIDPATGEPAWTGVISATATAPTALEAEAIAKAALLSGPAGARERLARHGGVLVHPDGRGEPVTPARRR